MQYLRHRPTDHSTLLPDLIRQLIDINCTANKAKFLKLIQDLGVETARAPRGWNLLDVDGRFFDHDQRVAQVRIVLENSGVVKEWISERQLSEIEEYRKYLPTEFRPDAIYVTLEGKRVAFELEIARKTKERYQQKVKRYIHMMTVAPDAERLFEEVHYICEKETVRNLIQDHTQLFQPLFRFSMLNEVLGE